MTAGVVLRPPVEADLESLADLRRDRLAQHLLLAHPADSPVTDDDVRAWIARRQGDPRGLFRVVAPDGPEQVCAGFVQITDVHGIDRHGALGICIGAGYRGRGLGRAAMHATLALAAGQMNLRKIMLHVRSDNAAAIALYASLGFATAGVLRDHYDDGARLHDVLLMERFLDGGVA